MQVVGSLKICTLMYYFTTLQLFSHDTEEWSKLWRKTHFLFEKWHKKFDEFYNVWAKIIQASCVVKNDLWFQKWYMEFGEFSHK